MCTAVLEVFSDFTYLQRCFWVSLRTEAVTASSSELLEDASSVKDDDELELEDEDVEDDDEEEDEEEEEEEDDDEDDEEEEELLLVDDEDLDVEDLELLELCWFLFCLLLEPSSSSDSELLLLLSNCFSVFLVPLLLQDMFKLLLVWSKASEIYVCFAVQGFDPEGLRLGLLALTLE